MVLLQCKEGNLALEIHFECFYNNLEFWISFVCNMFMKVRMNVFFSRYKSLVCILQQRFLNKINCIMSKTFMIDLWLWFHVVFRCVFEGQLCFCWKIKKVIATCNFLFTIQTFFLKFISHNSELKSRNYEFISCNSNAFSELWDINSELWDINLQLSLAILFLSHNRIKKQYKK